MGVAHKEVGFDQLPSHFRTVITKQLIGNETVFLHRVNPVHPRHLLVSGRNIDVCGPGVYFEDKAALSIGSLIFPIVSSGFVPDFREYIRRLR